MPNKKNITDTLTHALHPLRKKLDALLLDELVSGFAQWEFEADKENLPEEEMPLKVIRFLWYRVDEHIRELGRLRERFTAFSKRYTGAISVPEQREHILSFARDLGASPSMLKKDEKAFSRWFGADAVTDRYRRRAAALERRMAFCLDRLGVLTERILNTAASHEDLEKLWHRLKTERAVSELLDHDGDRRVRIEAFKCLSRALKALPESLFTSKVEQSTLQFVFRSALDRQRHVWIQAEALELLEKISADSLETALKNRFSDHSGKDDIFVRSRAVQILGRNLNRLTEVNPLFLLVSRDHSAFVRQTMADAIVTADSRYLRYWLHHLATNDAAVQVRASAVLKIGILVERLELFDYLLKLMAQILVKEKDPFVLRVSLKVCADCQKTLTRTGIASVPEKWYKSLLPRIEKLHTGAKNLSVRRWAAQYRERMWCDFHPQARELNARLREALQKIKPGKQKRFSKNFFKGTDQNLIGRVLAVITQEDFGCDIRMGRTGIRIFRGFHFDFRLWRFIYEVLHPTPDKRQAFSHTIGRIFHGTIQAPSGILSELAITKVPGEPLFMPQESGWRPYLPLVDQIISAVKGQGLFGAGSVHIHTAEGRTDILPPKFFWKRWWALIQLTFRFPHYARLRNWDENGLADPMTYAGAFKKLGIAITFSPYQTSTGILLEDPAVARFFAAREKPAESVNEEDRVDRMDGV